LSAGGRIARLRYTDEDGSHEETGDGMVGEFTLSYHFRGHGHLGPDPGLGGVGDPDFATACVTGAAAVQACGRAEQAAERVTVLQHRTVFHSLRSARERSPPASGPAHRQQIEQVIALLRDAGLPA
jgi:hypothetical protein